MTRRLLMMGLLIAPLFSLTTTSQLLADEVVLTQGDESLKATIGDEIFTVFHYGKSLPKPYFLPVVAPKGMEALRPGQPEGEFDVSNRVTVCSESAELRVLSESVGEVKLGEELEVASREEGWLWIPARNGWINERDVAPLAATVTRVVNPDPPSIKDRKHPLYYDHPHHKGIWNSVDEVNGIKFWNEDGRIENVAVEVLTAKGSPAVFKATNHWLDADGKPLVIETTTYSLFPNSLMIADIAFTAADKPVTFGDTKEGMFAIRLTNSMREMVANGLVVNADGTTGTVACWGRASNWVDYSGPVAGHTYGVTLMDHPENPRPSRYHVRNYGLFSINPFGAEAYTKGKDDAQEAQPATIKPGDSPLRFRYGLFVHNGTAEDAPVSSAYEQFVEAAGK